MLTPLTKNALKATNMDINKKKIQILRNYNIFQHFCVIQGEWERYIVTTLTRQNMGGQGNADIG